MRTSYWRVPILLLLRCGNFHFPMLVLSSFMNSYFFLELKTITSHSISSVSTWLKVAFLYFLVHSRIPKSTLTIQALNVDFSQPNFNFMRKSAKLNFDKTNFEAFSVALATINWYYILSNPTCDRSLSNFFNILFDILTCYFPVSCSFYISALRSIKPFAWNTYYGRSVSVPKISPTSLASPDIWWARRSL